MVRRGGLSDQKIKKGTFLRIEKLSFWESPVKFRDVAGTPIVGVVLWKCDKSRENTVLQIIKNETDKIDNIQN